MITSVQFDEALKVIADYKTQVIKTIIINSSAKNNTVKLQNQISSCTFKALRLYYENEYQIILEWNDLAFMDENLLANINFDKLLYSRGFGIIALANFKKILVLNDVLTEEDSK